MVGRYKVITLCGSTRFKDQFFEAQKRLTLEGNIVISVGLFGHSGDDEAWTEGTKEMLDDMHKRKIDMADEIFVINVGGYIGSSTRSEIVYAEANGKTVRYLESQMTMTYENYIHQFMSLNTNKYHGYKAPHKPIMLLSVIDLVEAGEINGNCFGMSENLEKKFHENWLRYVGTSIVFKPMPATPFYHLSSEPFWKLYNSAGVQINKLQSTPSVAYLRNNKISAAIDDDLFTFLKSTENRARLRTLIISTYFSKNE